MSTTDLLLARLGARASIARALAALASGTFALALALAASRVLLSLGDAARVVVEVAVLAVTLALVTQLPADLAKVVRHDGQYGLDSMDSTAIAVTLSGAGSTAASTTARVAAPRGSRWQANAADESAGPFKKLLLLNHKGMSLSPVTHLPNLFAASKERICATILEHFGPDVLANALQVPQEELALGLADALELQLGNDVFPDREELHGREAAFRAVLVIAVDARLLLDEALTELHEPLADAVIDSFGIAVKLAGLPGRLRDDLEGLLPALLEALAKDADLLLEVHALAVIGKADGVLELLQEPHDIVVLVAELGPSKSRTHLNGGSRFR